MSGEAKGSRGPGRPSNRERADSLSSTIENGLLKRDARAQAEWLAALAGRNAGVEKTILKLFGAGSLIGAAGAFGPLAGALVDRVRVSTVLGWVRGHGDEDEPEQPPQPFVH